MEKDHPLASARAKARKRLGQAIRRRAAAIEKKPSLRNLIHPAPTPAAPTRKKPKKWQQRYDWAEAYYDTPLKPKQIFYEAFAGNGALCNPRAVFDYLIDHEEFSEFEHVWALSDGESRIIFESEFMRRGNVRTVTPGSVEYWQELSTSTYLFNNSTFPWKFSKRPGQVYVNTWHGTPLKKMGYDSNEGAFGAANILRNFVQADFLISPNSYTTEVMYQQAYKLDGIFEGEVLEYGYPRVDEQFMSKDRGRDLLSYLRTTGMNIPEGKPVVVYAPTWRGKDFASARSSAEKYKDLVHAFDERFGDSAVLLLKVHQQVYKLEKSNPDISSRIIPNSVPTNQVLAIADTLVSDYSSIWIDYLSSGKPVVLFTPDQSHYESTRGVYFTERPGAVVDTVSDLLDSLASALPDVWGGTSPEAPSDAYRELATRMVGLEDGKSTRRLVDRVFHQVRASEGTIGDAGPREVSLKQCTKRKLLIYMGGMRRNGISTSGLNLLNNLDPDVYDVSIWAPRPGKSADMDVYARVPDHVRQFLRHDSHPLSADGDQRMSSFLNDCNLDNHDVPDDVLGIFKTEWSRCFGASKFDNVIDFSGYAGFWSLILGQGPCSGRRLVWAHNDLESDRRKLVDGKHPNEEALTSQYKAYQFFDGLVSVSPALSEVNAANLWKFVKPGGFHSVRNSLDLKRLQRTRDGGDVFKDLPSADGHALPVNELARYLLQEDRLDVLREALVGLPMQDKVFEEGDMFHFVNVARLAPEKNQHRLLEAFALCYESNRDVRLVIVGEGPLRHELEEHARELGVSHVVSFTGNQPEALSYMQRADLFVLSSDFEGQPMVFMESLAMGTPVLSVDFPTVGAAIPEGQGEIVASDSGVLGQAMTRYSRGESSVSVTFKPSSYNAEVMIEFEDVLGD